MKFRDLTPEQVKKICNGCGGKGSWVPVPQFIFHASCEHHDFNYWLGGTEADRKKADKQFYQAMKKDIKDEPWWKRPWYHILAYTYYKAVRIKGGEFFCYKGVA